MTYNSRPEWWALSRTRFSLRHHRSQSPGLCETLSEKIEAREKYQNKAFLRYCSLWNNQEADAQCSEVSIEVNGVSIRSIWIKRIIRLISCFGILHQILSLSVSCCHFCPYNLDHERYESLTSLIREIVGTRVHTSHELLKPSVRGEPGWLSQRGLYHKSKFWNYILHKNTIFIIIMKN